MHLTVQNRSKILSKEKNVYEGDGEKKECPSLQTIYEGSVVRLARRILNDLLPSGRRYRAFKCKTNRLKLLFIPSSIIRLNKETCWFSHKISLWDNKSIYNIRFDQPLGCCWALGYFHLCRTLNHSLITPVWEQSKEKNISSTSSLACCMFVVSVFIILYSFCTVGSHYASLSHPHLVSSSFLFSTPLSLLNCLSSLSAQWHFKDKRLNGGE